MYRQVKFVFWFPIVIAAAFAAGYLFWQKTLIPGPYDLEPVGVVRHQTTENLDTSNWQTYHNEKYGFEFKYPRNWVPNSGLRSEPDSPKIFTTGFGDARNPFRSVFIVIYSKQQAPEKSKGQIFYFPGGRGVIVENRWLLAEKDGIVIQVWPTHESEDKGFINQILSTFKFLTAETQKNEETVCIQVITRAKNPRTGEIRDFSTPCDVPENWEIIR